MKGFAFCQLESFRVETLQEKETTKVMGISQSAIGDPGQGMCLYAMYSWSNLLSQRANHGIN